MQFKKFFILTIAFAFLPWTASAAISETTRTYLSSAGNDPWVIQARAAIGLPAGDVAVDTGELFALAKSILALAAAGEDPRATSDGDLIALLKTREFSNSQIGNPSYINDDAWGILALRAASIAPSDEVIRGGADAILRAQTASGGWSWSARATATPDIDDTAAMIMALVHAGIPRNDARMERAVGMLFQSQNDDGGFPNMQGGASNGDSTAWTVLALRALGEPMGSWKRRDATPIDYLEKTMQGDGSWGNARTTAFAVLALSGKTMPVRGVAGSSATAGQGAGAPGSTGATSRNAARAIAEEQEHDRVMQKLYPIPKTPAPVVIRPTVAPVVTPEVDAPVISQGQPSKSVASAFPSQFIRFFSAPAAPSIIPSLVAPSVGVDAKEFVEPEAVLTPRERSRSAVIDSDRDGYTDREERASGFDPYDPAPCPPKAYGTETTAYGTRRLSSLENEACRSYALRNAVERMIGGSLGVSAAQWQRLTQAYLYGGYAVQDIALAVRGGKNINWEIRKKS